MRPTALPALPYARTLSQTERTGVLAPAAGLARGRRPPRGGLDLEPVQHVAPHVLAAQLVGDQRLEVHGGQLLLAVGDLLEALERRVEHLAVEFVAHLLQRFAQRMPAGVLAEHDRVAAQPDRGRVHDLVRAALLEHAVLVYPSLVRERVAADDRLVGLNLIAGQP